MKLEDKIKLFIKESIKESEKAEFTEEQKRIYNAFTLKHKKPLNFKVKDLNDNIIDFVLYTNKKDDGVLHILKKYYKEKTGEITTKDILNIFDVIRYGKFFYRQNKIIYELKTKEKKYKLIICLKETGTEKNILKSFYSDKNYIKKSKNRPVANKK